MGALWNDIKYSLRQLLKSPGFTVVALITLAIGIGANAIAFSIVDLLSFRPSKVKEPEQLVCCNLNYSLGARRYSIYQTIRDNNPVFSDVMAQDDGFNEVTLMRENTTRKVLATYVTSNYFSFLGVAPVIGRGFLPEEEQQDALPVVVLSYRIWQNLGGDSKIVGQYVTIDSVRFQVVGVAPEGFTGITIIGPDLWLPVGSNLAVESVFWRSMGRTISEERKERFYPMVTTVGRLKSGLSMETSQRQLLDLVPRLMDNYPQIWTSDFSLQLQKPGRFSISEDPEEQRVVLNFLNLTLMGISSLILIIACMNLANMLIIQGAGRHREIAIRLALGGARRHIIGQLLIESLLLALLGGALGLILAYWGTRILNVWIAASKLFEYFDLRTSLSTRVLAVTLGISLVTAVLFGLIPALGLSRSDLVTELKESGSAMFLPVRRKKRYLSVLFQIALAVMFVLAASIYTRSYFLLAQTDPSFRMDNKLIVEIDPLSAGYDNLRSAEACESLADHLASFLGVEAVGVSTRFTFGGGGTNGIVEYAPEGEGDESRRYLASEALVADVGRDYFAAMEIPLLQGRPFNQLDIVADAEKVAIIDESLARKLRPDGKALDCLIQYSRFTEYSEPYRVVGIVPNVQGISTEKETGAQMYRPIQPEQLNRSQFSSFLYLLLSDTQSSDVLKQRLRDEIRRVQPYLPVISLETLTERYYNDIEIWISRFWARLAVIAGVTALFLAALGIYTVRAYMVASRTTEIGIRMALGATRGGILVMVLRESIVLTLEGLFVGLLLAYIVVWIIRFEIYGVSLYDPISIIMTVVCIGLASLLASYIPARRATKIDPMNALRYE